MDQEDPKHLKILGPNCLFKTLSLSFQKMLEYLKDKKDVGFFLSVQALMQTCG